MEGVVAKRTLKRSYYENHNISITNENEKYNEKDNKREGIISSLKERVVFKLAIQGITTIAILTFITLIKIMNIKIILESDVTNRLKREFNKNYTFREVKEDLLGLVSTGYTYIEGIIPDKLEQKVDERNKQNKIYAFK